MAAVLLGGPVANRRRGGGVLPPLRLVGWLLRCHPLIEGGEVVELRGSGGWRGGGDVVLVRRAGPRSVGLADGRA